ncbi:hypothetical protein KC353_g46 [Hortaea werneckii]|nr:hypothetical protein KC353_g46 [Hortaea werneckii]
METQRINITCIIARSRRASSSQTPSLYWPTLQHLCVPAPKPVPASSQEAFPAPSARRKHYGWSTGLAYPTQR